jgi:hypothetical protein
MNLISLLGPASQDSSFRLQMAFGLACRRNLLHTRVTASHGGLLRTQDRKEPFAISPCNFMAIGGDPSMEDTLRRYDVTTEIRPPRQCNRSSVFCHIAAVALVFESQERKNAND